MESKRTLDPINFCLDIFQNIFVFNRKFWVNYPFKNSIVLNGDDYYILIDI